METGKKNTPEKNSDVPSCYEGLSNDCHLFGRFTSFSLKFSGFRIHLDFIRNFIDGGQHGFADGSAGSLILEGERNNLVNFPVIGEEEAALGKGNVVMLEITLGFVKFKERETNGIREDMTLSI